MVLEPVVGTATMCVAMESIDNVEKKKQVNFQGGRLERIFVPGVGAASGRGGRPPRRGGPLGRPDAYKPNFIRQAEAVPLGSRRPKVCRAVQVG